MIKVKDEKLLNKYITEYKIADIFTEDMKPYMELMQYKKHEFICRENELIEHLLFFVKGKAKVYITLSNGKSLLLCFYHAFKILGDLEFANVQTGTTNVQAIEESYCVGICLKKASECLYNDAKFLRYICNTLGEKLDRCSKNSSINLLYPLENRLASYILAAGERIDNVICFSDNLTEISELLGTSYRHLLRTLNILCDKGYIMRQGHGFVVIDENKLGGLAADLYM